MTKFCGWSRRAGFITRPFFFFCSMVLLAEISAAQCGVVLFDEKPSGALEFFARSATYFVVAVGPGASLRVRLMPRF